MRSLSSTLYWIFMLWFLVSPTDLQASQQGSAGAQEKRVSRPKKKEAKKPKRARKERSSRKSSKPAQEHSDKNALGWTTAKVVGSLAVATAGWKAYSTGTPLKIDAAEDAPAGEDRGRPQQEVQQKESSPSIFKEEMKEESPPPLPAIDLVPDALGIPLCKARFHQGDYGRDPKEECFHLMERGDMYCWSAAPRQTSSYKPTLAGQTYSVTCITPQEHHKPFPLAFAFLAHEMMLAIYPDLKLYLIHLPSGGKAYEIQDVQALPIGSRALGAPAHMSFSISPTGRAALGIAELLLLYQVMGKKIQLLKKVNLSSRVQSVTLLGDGKSLVYTQGHEVVLRAIPSQKILHTFGSDTYPKSPMIATAFSAEQQVVAFANQAGALHFYSLLPTALYQNLGTYMYDGDLQIDGLRFVGKRYLLLKNGLHYISIFESSPLPITDKHLIATFPIRDDTTTTY